MNRRKYSYSLPVTSRARCKQSRSCRCFLILLIYKLCIRTILLLGLHYIEDNESNLLYQLSYVYVFQITKAETKEREIQFHIRVPFFSYSLHSYRCENFTKRNAPSLIKTSTLLGSRQLDSLLPFSSRHIAFEWSEREGEEE